MSGKMVCTVFKVVARFQTATFGHKVDFWSVVARSRQVIFNPNYNGRVAPQSSQHDEVTIKNYQEHNFLPYFNVYLEGIDLEDEPQSL